MAISASSVLSWPLLPTWGPAYLTLDSARWWMRECRSSDASPNAPITMPWTRPPTFLPLHLPLTLLFLQHYGQRQQQSWRPKHGEKWGQKGKRAKVQKGKRAKGQRQIRKANHKPLWKIRIGVLSEETLKFFPGFGNFENCLLG